jgi:predicted dehydrogenase
MVAAGKVAVAPLVTHRFPVQDAAEAYRLISGKTKKARSFLGVLLTYPSDSVPVRSLAVRPGTVRPSGGEEGVRLGVLGAGLFATQVALPAVARIRRIEKVSIVSAGGLTAARAARDFGFQRAAADAADVLDDPEINTVGIFTRHHLHAGLTAKALRNGKHVFCEKPLALRSEELAEVERAWAEAAAGGPRVLMVGFNRRFAPLTVILRKAIVESGEPPVMAVRVNAGPISRGHWTQDPEQGGGRILGEACHFVDLMTFLAGARPTRVFAGGAPAFGVDTEDNFAATFEFANGAVGSLVYASSGDRAFPKERIEVYCGERAAALDDFRMLEIWRAGHRQVWQAFIRSIQNGAPAPIPPEELFGVTRATFALLLAVRYKAVEDIAA